MRINNVLAYLVEKISRLFPEKVYGLAAAGLWLLLWAVALSLAAFLAGFFFSLGWSL